MTTKIAEIAILEIPGKCTEAVVCDAVKKTLGTQR